MFSYAVDDNHAVVSKFCMTFRAKTKVLPNSSQNPLLLLLFLVDREGLVQATTRKIPPLYASTAVTAL